MTSTSLSILERAKSRRDEQAWRELEQIYSPLLRRWLVQHQVAESDAEDLIQEVLLFVAQRIPDFEHNGRPGAFRGWLRQVLVNRLRKLWNARKDRPGQAGTGNTQVMHLLQQLEDPRSGLTQLWSREHDRHVLAQTLDRVQQEFAGTTWEAFRLTSIDGEKPRQVAEKLQISPNAVWIAKSRVLRRLRELSAGLVDSP